MRGAAVVPSAVLDVAILDRAVPVVTEDDRSRLVGSIRGVRRVVELDAVVRPLAMRHEVVAGVIDVVVGLILRFGLERAVREVAIAGGRTVEPYAVYAEIVYLDETENGRGGGEVALGVVVGIGVPCRLCFSRNPQIHLVGRFRHAYEEDVVSAGVGAVGNRQGGRMVTAAEIDGVVGHRACRRERVQRSSRCRTVAGRSDGGINVLDGTVL